MIHWPAIIQYAGQAELAWVPDLAALQAELQAHGTWRSGDRLIDSRGEVYQPHGEELPQATGQTLPLAAVLDLVRAHAAAQGLCCIAKLSAPTLDTAVLLVGTLHED